MFLTFSDVHEDIYYHGSTGFTERKALKDPIYMRNYTENVHLSELNVLSYCKKKFFKVHQWNMAFRSL